MKLATCVMWSVVSLCLSACGGSGPTGSATNATALNGTSSGSTASQAEMINGIVVPPDPGFQKDATLVGIDADANGIRDEIDRWIATKYWDKPQSLDAIRMTARADQKFLTINPRTTDEARKAIFELMDVGGCVAEKLRDDGINASEFFDETTFRANNTRLRIDEYKRVMALAGPIVRNANDWTIDCPYAR